MQFPSHPLKINEYSRYYIPGGGEAGEGEDVAPAPGGGEHRRLAELEELGLLPRQDGVAGAGEARVRGDDDEVGAGDGHDGAVVVDVGAD